MYTFRGDMHVPMVSFLVYYFLMRLWVSFLISCWKTGYEALNFVSSGWVSEVVNLIHGLQYMTCNLKFPLSLKNPLTSAIILFCIVREGVHNYGYRLLLNGAVDDAPREYTLSPLEVVQSCLIMLLGIVKGIQYNISYMICSSKTIFLSCITVMVRLCHLNAKKEGWHKL